MILFNGRWVRYIENTLNCTELVLQVTWCWLVFNCIMQCLFRTPLNNYDAVVLLHREKIPYPHHLLFPSELNQGPKHGSLSLPLSLMFLSLNPKTNVLYSRNVIWAGKHVARGKASKAFNPFLLPGDLKRSPEELKKKLMVDFEPTKCFMSGLQEEFGTLKPWYDHIGGDAIGLTWTKHNSKVKEQNVW